MALMPSAEAKPLPAPQSPGVAWGVIAVALLAGWGWVKLAQKLGETIEIESPAGAMSLFYALMFVPLIVIALAAGLVGHVRVLRAGAAPGRWAALGTAAGAGALGATVGFAWLNGEMVRGELGGAAASMVALGLALTLLQVAAEEIMFRGWLQPALIDRLGPVPGLFAGALVFSAFHVAGGGASAWASLVNLLLGGVLFGLLAYRSGGLVAPLLAHFAYNWIEDGALGLTPNPGVGPLGALADWDLMGSPLWGGTEEGLNASLGLGVALLALIVLLLVRARAPAPAPLPAA